MVVGPEKTQTHRSMGANRYIGDIGAMRMRSDLVHTYKEVSVTWSQKNPDYATGM